MRYLVNQITGELEKEAADLSIIAPKEKDIDNLSGTYNVGDQFIYRDKLYTITGVSPYIYEESDPLTKQLSGIQPDFNDLIGATDTTDGERGLAPQPLAGDQDKVLQGDGGWGHKLQIDVVIQNGVYGYIGANNTFIPFKSQADIDAAVAAARVGTATAADVLAGKTFTNSTASGLTGSMEDLSTNNRYQHNSTNSTPVILGDTGYFSTVYDKVSGTDLGDYFQIRYIGPPNKNASNNDTAKGYLRPNTLIALPCQTKSVTPSSSEQIINPDDGKVLWGVVVNPISASGTYTASSRGTALDMGATNNYRYVNTNSVPNTNSGTYTPSSNGTALDMGATNTYRYVNTSTVYDLGVSDGKASVNYFSFTLLCYLYKSHVDQKYFTSGSGTYFNTGSSDSLISVSSNWGTQSDQNTGTYATVTFNKKCKIFYYSYGNAWRMSDGVSMQHYLKISGTTYSPSSTKRELVVDSGDVLYSKIYGITGTSGSGSMAVSIIGEYI